MIFDHPDTILYCSISDSHFSPHQMLISYFHNPFYIYIYTFDFYVVHILVLHNSSSWCVYSLFFFFFVFFSSMMSNGQNEGKGMLFWAKTKKKNAKITKVMRDDCCFLISIKKNLAYSTHALVNNLQRLQSVLYVISNNW